MAGVATTYLRWMYTRALLHRGYWLVASLYLVLDADLSPFELVFLGTAQGIISLAFEVPAGVVADTISRKWSLVTSHVLMGTSMAVTGLVTDFWTLVATQMLWGVAWTFASGADVAWVTDELDRPDRIAGVLTASARWELIGSASGMVGLGILAWLTGRSEAIVVAGVAMVLLGLYVALRFTEHRFTPTRKHRWRRSATILRRGVGLARADHQIMLVLAATVLVNGAAEAFGRLHPKRLIELGFPEQPDPIIWLTGLGILGYLAGALAMRFVEARIDGVGATRRIYAAACALGAAGMALLVVAPDAVTGSAGVLLVGGVALTVTRAVGVVWVNRRTASDVRATTQSFLAQAEYSGEILCGIALAAVAQMTSIAVAFAGAGAIFLLTGAMVRFARRTELMQGSAHVGS